MQVAVLTIIGNRHFGIILSGRVLDADHPRQGQIIRVKAEKNVLMDMPEPGESWEFDGETVDTPWGLQVAATRAWRRLPAGRLITDFLALHVPGVGPDRAERLWRQFGLDLPAVLADDGRVLDVATIIAPDRPNLAPRLAVACIAAWKRMAAQVKLVFWLMDHGIEDVQLVRRLGLILGDEAVARLEANPYILTALLPWRKVDALGLALLAQSSSAAPREDTRRLVGAADAAVKAMLANGNTAMTDLALQAAMAKNLGFELRSPRIPAAIAVAERNLAIRKYEKGWRAPGCASMEDAVIARLRRMLECDYPAAVAIPPAGDLRRLLDRLERAGGGTLHPEQRAAVEQVLKLPLSCLQGGAGVGKTTTTRMVCDAWQELGGAVVLCTIAGKAALRLSRSTGRLAMTIARLLSQLRERTDIEGKIGGGLADAAEHAALTARLKCLAEFNDSTLLIVDEASMLDLSSAHALLRQLPEGARLLMVGDEAQLPPVGFGLLFQSLIHDDVITARLQKVHRQTEAGGIPTVASTIRCGRTLALQAYVGPAEGVTIVACDSASLASAVITVHQELATQGREALVVTATNEGQAGVQGLNSSFHNLHVDATADVPQLKGPLGQWFSVGEPAVYLCNDYRRGLFNGLMGRIVAIDLEAGSCRVLFEGYDSAHDLGATDLIDLSLAYAVTCHRAQGSQAEAVIIPLYETQVMDPSWLYTAVTRAERQVVLVGPPGILRAVQQRLRASDRRQIGFEWCEANENTSRPASLSR